MAGQKDLSVCGAQKLLCAIRRATFDRGTRFLLAVSRKRAPRHAPRAEDNHYLCQNKTPPRWVVCASSFLFLNVGTDLSVCGARNSLTSLSLGEFRPRHPLFARCISHRERSQTRPTTRSACRGQPLSLPKQNTTPLGGVLFWQGQKDLNPRHAVLETAALPTELYPYLCKVCCHTSFTWWAFRDLNPGPTGYEPVALTN